VSPTKQPQDTSSEAPKASEQPTAEPARASEQPAAEPARALEQDSAALQPIYDVLAMAVALYPEELGVKYAVQAAEVEVAEGKLKLFWPHDAATVTTPLVRKQLLKCLAELLE
jgi:hypothetical protein